MSGDYSDGRMVFHGQNPIIYGQRGQFFPAISLDIEQYCDSWCLIMLADARIEVIVQKFVVIAVLVSVVGMTGCARIAPQAAVPAAEPVAAPAAAGAAASLPAAQLTGEILYDLLLGEIAVRRGELSVAADAFARAAIATRDHRVAERAMQTAMGAKDFDRAFEVATLWRELQPDAVPPMEAVAVAQVASNRLSEAKQTFSALIRRAEPEIGGTYRRIADLLSRQTNADGALALMADLVALHDDEADAHYSRAFLADRLKRPSLVVEALDRALELKPGWEDAALAKAAHLLSEEKTDELIAFSDAYLTAHPASNRLRLQYARFLVEHGAQEQALTQFNKVVEQQPTHSDALFAAALLSIQLERLDDAEKLLEQNLKLNPRNDQVRLYLGQVAAERKEFAKAETWYRQIDDGDYFFEAQLLLGDVYAKQSDTDRALSHLRALQPDSEEQHVRWILTQEQVLREGKNLHDAKLILDDGLERFPDSTELLYARGLVAAQLDMVDLHEQDMRKLLAKEPDNPHALNALGYTLADLTDRYQEAYTLIEKALALRPEDPFILDSMGWVQYRLGNYDLAIEYLQKALAKREDAEIAAHLGEVLWAVGQQKRAEAVWAQALEKSPENDTLLSTIRKLKK